jgi:hypothetical protein
MSWGEIKKAINSDLTEPFNYLHYISDIANFGFDGYVLKRDDLVEELVLKSNNVFKHDIASPLLFQPLAIINSNIGLFFEKLTEDTTSAFDGINTLSNLVSSTNAMNVVAGNSIAMTAIVESTPAIAAVAGSTTAMTSIMASSTARPILFNSVKVQTAFRASTTAKNYLNSIGTNLSSVGLGNTLITLTSRNCWVVSAETGSATTSGNRQAGYFKHLVDGVSSNTVTIANSPYPGNPWPLLANRMFSGLDIMTQSISSSNFTRTARVVYMD